MFPWRSVFLLRTVSDKCPAPGLVGRPAGDRGRTIGHPAREASRAGSGVGRKGRVGAGADHGVVPGAAGGMAGGVSRAKAARKASAGMVAVLEV
ncbi:hypothetical protein SKB0092_26950 [Roseomonas mucosa]